MTNTYTELELETLLCEIDGKLANRGVPLRFRPLEAFKHLYGPVPDDSRQLLFDPITFWFYRKYGSKLEWDGIIGRIPVVLRGELYLVKVPFLTEDTIIRLTDRFEGLADEIAKGLTPEEFDEIGRKIHYATGQIQNLYSLHVDDYILSEPERALVRRALYDFEHTATSLRQTGDTQNAVFHSHAAAEKFLKAALLRANPSANIRSYRHKIDSVFDVLLKVQPRFSWLKGSVDALSAYAPNMEIRYSEVSIALEDAIVAFNAAVNICGMLASVWILDHKRGSTTSGFQEGKFYVDSARRTFYCKSLVPPDQAVLTLFQSHPAVGSIMANITLNVLQSCLYLEVSEKGEVQELRRRLDVHLANPGRPVSPEEIRLKISSGPEGSYTTAIKSLPLATKRAGT